ncbi:MAG: hypothetical protein Q7J31_10115 [Syntrophales bacterium]|nr:hypothetical protein [Syntrophales bacterium]
MKRRLFVFVGVIAIAIMGYLAYTVVDSTTPVATAGKKAYSTTAYVAGHGGHFAKAEVVIDPNNADDPLKVSGLDKVDIGDTKTHKVHDPRIDANDRNILFWATNQKDPQGKVHIGKSDLKTGKVIKDLALDLDPRSPGAEGPLYCASGQSKKNYIPIFMGVAGYVDVLDKATLDRKHRVFVSDLGYKPEVQFMFHGVNSNDMKKFALSMTLKGEDGKPNGKTDIILVDFPALEKGKFKEIKRTTLTGEPGKTNAFRQYFSKDDKYLFQAAGDRVYVLDAKTLAIVDEKKTPGENHDAMPTPDGKYALLTLRTDAKATGPDGKVVEKNGKPVGIKDGALVAYDFEAKKIIGKPVSVCIGCHQGMGLGDKTAILCGVDANYKK